VAVGTIIVDGYSMRQFFITYNETNIPIVDEEGEICVKKKKYTFWKRKQNVGHFDQLVSKIVNYYPKSLFGM